MTGSVEKGNGAGHGGPARGYSWPSFSEGNEAAKTHGAYAVVALRGRADEVAAGLRAAMGGSYEPRFESAVGATAMIGARLERAMDALTVAEKPSELARLDQDARGWMRLYLGALDRLGLTPAAAGRLGLDLVRTEDALAQLSAVGREIRERRGIGVDSE